MRDTAGLVVTGLGVTTAVGQGKTAFTRALFAAEHRFAVMDRPGRQLGTRFVGAELPALEPTTRLGARELRTASLTGQVALSTLEEAWTEAGLDGCDPDRVGLVIGGSNLQQRELVRAQDRHRAKPHFLRPSYGLSFLDTDLCGLCTSAFGIRGLAHTVGGASASGQLAVIEAAEAVASGRVDVCVALGALADLSHWELLGLHAMGAMAAEDHADAPADACRPFDKARSGFVYGEACAALVIERRGARPDAPAPYARLSGWSVRLDGNRDPNPSLDGETAAIRQALDRAGLTARDIDYVNPHGTASPAGDTTEVAALKACGLTHAAVNATKSITGHGLTAAGAVEAAASLLQMRHGRLHPTRNLTDPVDDAPRWVRGAPVEADIQHCLSLSMGFGGINTALCLSACDA
ncbi:beta-ketoacyl synthase N-terminal-like domain-containing protein [Streptomyces aurantiacus]|uniref:Putative Polyketide biosynthesis malonyl-ACP decarboxylase PksF n=1 Tax=Streptomyces aurantiacus JA 4570 TaxID=1286094 RepID=S4AQX7_9ACTN|nr:beta-ketoacyl synthase N-terminal-like domain-containing protein [Streptomyces aurantiacus]EPH43877.1 putative Polyketide biosynthesis malonyl-ACP decarboxylase PksF [Streptomyces aurantiacus JA 4570]